ncbi:MAG: condensation domain-containing protein, partial [Pseudomonadales bacterium]|nr:condensation domain-containing protein [Pseudomonadales bacterium]
AIDETILRPYSSPVCIALLANTVFDASVQQIFSTLLLGHCLYVVDPESKRDPALLMEKFKIHQVVLSDCTPSLLGVMLSQDSTDFDSLSLELLITGGEALSLELVQRFYEKSSRINLINVYGPTECCVDVTAYRLTRDCLPDSSVIPLGKPLRNTQLFVLAANGTPAPVGVPGEIYIAGSGLSRGYLNRPEQDQFKFVNLPQLSPFKLYRTGDLGRWSLDGNLEYLGRLDDQIKLKGFRIEPGEIEHRLLQHPSVLNTVVMVNGQQLIAYVVFRSELNAPARTALLDFLAETLPDYMVPHHLYVLDEIPLTPSGKVDRKHLPSPETLQTVASGIEVKPPVTPEERVLVETLGEVLGNGNISIDDNYFALGGDSIKAIQTISKLHRKGFHLEVKSLFKTPVLKTLANLLTPLLAEKGALPLLNEQTLSPIQKRFMNNHGATLDQFNHALLFFPLDGGSEQPGFTTKGFTTNRTGRYDIDKLKAALQAVFEQHRSLSLKFAGNGQLRSTRKLSWQHHDLTRNPEWHARMSEIGEQVQSEFDINTGKVFSAHLFSLPEGDRLLLSAHHLVIDAVSWQILIADLEDHYQSLLRGNPVQTQRSPAAQTPGWLDWIEATKRFASSKAILKDIQYWVALEAEVEQAQTSAYQNAANQKQSPSPCLATHLQFTSPYGAVQTEQLELSEQLTSQLLREANQAYGTNTQDLLVSGVMLALYEYTAMPALLLELESHGRDIFSTDQLHTKGIDSAAVTGWFTNVWPVLLRITENRDVGYQVKTIKELFRKVPHQGASYGLLENFGPKEFVNPLSFSLKPAISFNYLGEIATQNRAQHFQLSTRGQDAYFIDPKTVVSPDAKRPCPIELSALVQEGKMNLEIRFDPDWNKQYWPEFNPMVFLDYWLQQLDNVTANCLAQHQRDITPSDLSYSDISLEELEGIIS